MAGRDIKIPFGPDKTGGMGFLPLEDELPTIDLEPESDPFAEPPREKYADAPEEEHVTSLPVRSRKSSLRNVPSTDPNWKPPADDEDEEEPPELEPEFEPEPAEVAGYVEFDATAPVVEEPAEGDDAAAGARIIEAFPVSASGEAEEGEDAEYHAGGLPDEDAIAQGYDEMQMSFMALRDSVGQGRELKAREKELDEFAAQLDTDREELADREYILANYETVVGEQDRIVAEHTQRREARKAEQMQVAAKLQETTTALEQMREYHTTEMQPLETELGRARANADQAKNDERSRKSELNASESEMRRSGSSQDVVMASAKHDQVKRAYEEARARSEQAKETLAEVQRIYDDARQQIEQAEGPLERSIQDLQKHEAELKEEIASLGEEISAARKRRQHCDAVYQYPDETAKLRASVENDERTLNEMQDENEELRGLLAQSKQQARKAKLALGIVALIVVVFVIAIIVIAMRG